MMTRGKALFESGHLAYYQGPEPGTLIQQFRDDCTDERASNVSVIHGKGVINNLLSSFLLSCLESIGLHTYFVRRLNMREQVVQELELFPLKITVRSMASGDFATQLGLPNGIFLPTPMVEFRYTVPEMPLVNEHQITSFEWADGDEIEQMKAVALRANDYLSGLFFGQGLLLESFDLRFSRHSLDDYQGPYVHITSDLSLDALCLRDRITEQGFGQASQASDLAARIQEYQEIAKRFNLIARQEEDTAPCPA